MIVLTEDPALVQRIRREQKYIAYFGHEVAESTFEEPDSYLPLWLRLLFPLVKKML